ncbi:addiction module antidote protein [Taklimakanibacter lacteus]|uniref:addiction module antidote protein n=1 Tax=Taklimakanibacter lacteus TaxID=2268456 RepID=UPI000E671B48
MKSTTFDAAEYLDTPGRQADYLALALEGGDPDEVRDALSLIARARGMAEIASAAHLNRESLYRALGENGNPEFATVLKVINALGLRLTAAPIDQPRKRRTPARKAGTAARKRKAA